MMENSTSSRPWASLCAHCNTLAKWHTHEHHDILRPTINGQKVGNGSIPGNPHPFLDKVGIILYSLVYEITQSIKSNHSILEAREPLAFWDGPYSVCGVCLSLNKPTSYLKKKKKKKNPRLVLSLFSYKCPPPFFPSLLSSHSVHYLHHCLLNFHNGLLDDILFFYLIFKPSFSPYPFYSFKLLMLTIISLYT